MAELVLLVLRSLLRLASLQLAILRLALLQVGPNLLRGSSLAAALCGTTALIRTPPCSGWEVTRGLPLPFKRLRGEMLLADPSLFDKLTGKTTPDGVTLAVRMMTGVGSLNYPDIEMVGLTAGDEEPYEGFEVLLIVSLVCGMVDTAPRRSDPPILT